MEITEPCEGSSPGSIPGRDTRKYMMFKVIGKEETLKVLTLAEAMNVAKHMNEFVTIKGPEFEVCGIFGVDTVKDGKCPDGIAYDWNKASRIGSARTK